VLAAAVVARLWIVPLANSLWLDEFGTWWVTKARFADLLGRARLFPQSLPYVAIVWVERRLFGAGEVALRLPSLLAALLCVWAIDRLGRELVDRETGLLAAGLLVVFPPIDAAAAEERPYAFAVLAVIVATWMLARWARTGGGADTAGYAASASAAVYLHYLFGAVLPAHAAWLLSQARRRASRASAAQILATVGAIAILTAPAAALILEIGRSASLHNFRAPPGPLDVLPVLLPHRVLLPLILSVLAVAIATRFRLGFRLAADSRNAVWLLLLCVVVPVALLAVIAWATRIGVFFPRYLMSVLPAQALLLAWLVRGIGSAGARRAVLALCLAIVLLGRGIGTDRVRENWKDAAAAVRAANGGRPVLLDPGFVEASHLELVRNPAHADYMRAPLDYYDAGGETLVLPRRASENEAYVEGLLAGAALAGGFALIERTTRDNSWSEWLDRRTRKKGLAMRRVWDGERVSAWVFAPASCSPSPP
jgi:mannosyltransferase